MVALAPAVGVVAAAHVVVQAFHGQGHDQRAAMAVHDGLGHAGRAAGVHDPQRVVERQPQRLERVHSRIVAGGDLGQVHTRRRGVQRSAHLGGRLRQVGVQDHVLQRGQRGAHLGHNREPVEIAAAVGHAIAGDQDLGLDLPETIEHGVGAHVGRTHAPHAADAHGGEEGHHGLGDVGQVGGHAVAGLNPLCLQVQGQRRHLAPEFGPAQFDGMALFVAADDGRKAGGMGGHDMAKDLLRVVHLCTRKPVGAGHHVLFQHRCVGRGRLDIEVVPDALPVSFEIGGGPAPQRVVVVEMQATLLGQPVLIQADLGHEGRCLIGRWAHAGALLFRRWPDGLVSEPQRISGSAPTPQPR